LVTQVFALPGGLLHDSYVRNDTLYASHGYNGYYIYDFKTNPAAPKLLASTTTGGYNHNSWLTADGRYAYYTEEVPNGLPMRIVDLQQLATTGMIEILSSFLDTLTPNTTNTKPTPHNVYIKGNLLFDSQYEDGLLVYNISVPTAPKLVAYYDTHPQNTNYNGYFGNWGNYPWLPSGTIVCSDMQNGLSLLKLDSISDISGTQHPVQSAMSASITPNPATTSATITLHPQQLSGQTWQYRLLNLSGHLIRTSGQMTDTQASISLVDLPVGMYVVEIRRADGRNAVHKIVKQ
jgi:hypothetical protein